MSRKPVKGERLFLQIPALPAQVGEARHAVVNFLRHQGWQEPDTDAVMLAVGEAGSNAVRYSGGEEAAAIVSIVCTLLSSRCLQVEIRNPGDKFSTELETLCVLPPDDATHGRGFALMQFLMDDIQVFHTGSETVVQLTKSRTA